MLATDDEIRALESHALRGLPEARRLELVEHAVQRNRQARDGLLRTEPRRKCRRVPGNNGGARKLVLPTNANELRAAAIAEALRVCRIDAEDYGNHNDPRARWFVLVALAYVPAVGVFSKLGMLGPKRARAIMSAGVPCQGTHEEQLASRWPMLARRAREFGAGLIATWEAGT